MHLSVTLALIGMFGYALADTLNTTISRALGGRTNAVWQGIIATVLFFPGIFFFAKDWHPSAWPYFVTAILMGIVLNFASLAFKTRKRLPPKILLISFLLYPFSTNAFVMNG